jgi:hypothetical protein
LPRDVRYWEAPWKDAGTCDVRFVTKAWYLKSAVGEMITRRLQEVPEPQTATRAPLLRSKIST